MRLVFEAITRLVRPLLRWSAIFGSEGQLRMSKKVVLGVAVICLAGIGIFAYLWVIRLSGGFSAREHPSAMEALMARTTRRLAIPGEASKVKNPVTCSDDVLLQEAREHWADHCAFCHANNGSGDTEVGRNLYPKPPDMRKAPTQALSDGELYFAINNGIRLTGMPAWGEPGTGDQDSWKLVCFIRHLPKMTDAEMEQMEQMNPKTPMELREEQEEREFLEGSVPQKSSKGHKTTSNK